MSVKKAFLQKPKTMAGPDDLEWSKERLMPSNHLPAGPGPGPGPHDSQEDSEEGGGWLKTEPEDFQTEIDQTAQKFIKIEKDFDFDTEDARPKVEDGEDFEFAFCRPIKQEIIVDDISCTEVSHHGEYECRTVIHDDGRRVSVEVQTDELPEEPKEEDSDSEGLHLRTNIMFGQRVVEELLHVSTLLCDDAAKNHIVKEKLPRKLKKKRACKRPGSTSQDSDCHVYGLLNTRPTRRAGTNDGNAKHWLKVFLNGKNKDSYTEYHWNKSVQDTTAPPEGGHEESEQRFYCERCGKCFLSYSSLEDHLIEHNKISRSIKKEPMEYIEHNYFCEECGACCVGHEQFLLHIRAHNEAHRYKCPKCPKSYSKRVSLEQHVLRPHYSCNECPRIFDNRQNFLNHLWLHRNISRKNTTVKPRPQGTTVKELIKLRESRLKDVKQTDAEATISQSTSDSPIASEGMDDESCAVFGTPSTIVSGRMDVESCAVLGTPSTIVSGTMDDENCAVLGTPSTIVSGRMDDESCAVLRTPSTMVSGTMDDESCTVPGTPSTIPRYTTGAQQGLVGASSGISTVTGGILDPLSGGISNGVMHPPFIAAGINGTGLLAVAGDSKEICADRVLSTSLGVEGTASTGGIPSNMLGTGGILLVAPLLPSGVAKATSFTEVPSQEPPPLNEGASPSSNVDHMTPKAVYSSITEAIQHELYSHFSTLEGEGPGRFQCKKCKKTYKFRRHLESHIYTSHVDRHLINQFESCVCDVCGKVFHEEESLRSHMKLHNGDQPYVCSICNATFPYRRSHMIHSRTHVRSKPLMS